MESQLAVEAAETIATTETSREAVFVPITPGAQAVYSDPNFGDAVKAEGEIRRLAPEYHVQYNRAGTSRFRRIAAYTRWL